MVNGMFTHRPERLRGVSYIGAQQYFLTFCTFQRARHFVAAEHVDLTLSQIQQAAEGRNGLQFLRTASCRITSTCWSRAP